MFIFRETNIIDPALKVLNHKAHIKSSQIANFKSQCVDVDILNNMKIWSMTGL